MRYEIILSPEAADDLRRLDAYRRAMAKDLIDKHLRHEPSKISGSRIKKLKGLRRPQYRLRIDDLRVFYDINDRAVQVLAVVFKSDAAEWLKRGGEST